eukprot:comp19883_c0_seq1/m.24054 comp19883_c0_seq1/g.24054  ORF comp19883_c0_seq1/g.24054 comp19883_c0_seq1/m.24054 type:complete len:413 (-) comp19883_c0_seq1:262-1500(-)
MGFFGKYVSSKGAKHLPNYKYVGSDDSILYKLYGSKMIEALLPLVPSWVAPNLITVTGLMFTVVMNIVQVYYSPFMDVPTPRWVYIATGVALFLYQTFDAMDGKQARKTGSSSPLGLLFDHGCDAINTTVISLSLATTLQLGPTWWTAVVWSAMGVTFFAATWEEYYTGELHLPVINGPNEGIAMGVLIHIGTGVLQDPNDPFWLHTGPFGLQYNQCLVVALCLGASFTIIYNIINVVNAVYKNAQKESGNPHSLSGVVGPNTHLVAFTRAVPALGLIVCSMVWIYASPTDMMARHPRLVLWTLGLILSKLLTGLMLAHLCEEEYHPWSKTIAAMFALLLHAVIGYLMHLQHFGPMDINVEEKYEDLFVYEFFALSLMSWAHMVVGVIREVAGILGIYIFTITAKRDPKKVR